MSAVRTAPQELLDWLTTQGVDPATVSYWQLFVYCLRLVKKIHQAQVADEQTIAQHTADIAAIKTKIGL